MLTTNLSLLLPKTQFESFETNRLEFCNQYARLRFGYETTDGHVPDTVLCADCKSTTEVGQRVELIKVELSVFIFGGYYVQYVQYHPNQFQNIITPGFSVFDQNNDCRTWAETKDKAYKYIFENTVPRLFDFDIEKYKTKPELETEKYRLGGLVNTGILSRYHIDGKPLQFPMDVEATGEVASDGHTPIIQIGNNPNNTFALSHFYYTKL